MTSHQKKPLLLFLILISHLTVSGQDFLVNFRGGVSAFRGETSKEAEFLIEELGQDYSIIGYIPLDNAQWQVSAELSYSHAMAERDLLGGENFVIGTYKTTAVHYFLGAGMRYVFNSDAKGFNLYGGQFLPYIGLSAGLLNFQNSTNQELIPVSGFKISEEMFWGFTGQLELGFTIMLDDQIGLGAFGAGRLGTSDYWDGIDGLTNFTDWMMRGGIQLTYAFD
jgi:hypothetical protein